MHNIVSLDADRPRPPRMFGVPRSGARILFFTGVRYCRDEDDDAMPSMAGYDLDADAHAVSSERTFDATAH